ncbi:MAG TPA: copper transporter [Mycobacteriales bacterium]|nr:copper transporter [Mycobacteriales bacterium]
MIDFRYHIVSLVAVFLALALGLFLGSTSLQSTVTHSLRQQANHVTGLNHKLETTNDQLTQELSTGQAFATGVEPYAVGGRLVDAGVAVISAPGVDDGARSAMMSTLTSAGATVTADVRLQSAFLDPNQDDTLGQLALQLAGGRKLPHAAGAIQAGTELARALLARPGIKTPSQRQVETILSTLSDGNMITVQGNGPVHPGDLAVLLVPLGSGSPDSATEQQQNDDLIGLAAALRRDSSGVVVASPTLQSGADNGVLPVMRQDSALSQTVSTVDADETPIGRIATVLALAQAPAGAAGQYGASQKQPLPSASPAS